MRYGDEGCKITMLDEEAIFNWILDAEPGIYPITKEEAIPIFKKYIDLRSSGPTTCPEVEFNDNFTKIRVRASFKKTE